MRPNPVKTTLSSGAVVFVPRPKAAGVAYATIEAGNSEDFLREYFEDNWKLQPRNFLRVAATLGGSQ